MTTRRRSEDQDPPGIAERVRFWEEQDRINQTLIPRVIRQSELLNQHITEHDELPQLVGRVIAEALEEHTKQYAAALDKAETEIKDAYDKALAKADGELTEKYAQTLQKANEEQTERHAAAIATVRQESSRTRRWTAAIAAAAVATATAAVIIAILV